MLISFLNRRYAIRLALLFTALLALSFGVAWFFPQQVLTMDSGPVKADVLVVLGGGTAERPIRVAELFLEGEAPRILLSGAGDNVINEHILETNGIPTAAITIEGKSRTTRENAIFSASILRTMGAKRVILVTTWYHSRRALHCFEHYAPDIQFYSRPSYTGYAAGDPYRIYLDINAHIRAEYLKTAGYWLCYGVCPI